VNSNAYRPSHRNRFLLVQHEVLTRDEFIILEYCLDQMGFDRRNEKFGRVEIDFNTISSVLQYSTKPPFNSIRTKIKKFVELGILITTGKKNTFEVFNAERYIATSKKWGGKASEFREAEHNKPFEQIVQNIAPNFQTTEQIVQPLEQNVRKYLKVDAPRTLVSSKVNSNVNNPVVTTPPITNKRTMADYQRFYDEGIYQPLVPEEMKWLDEHMTIDGKTIL
jgi:hypothetical protein